MNGSGANLHALDWVVLVAYGMVLVATGWYFNRRAAKDTGEYFLGGRRMPVWAVAVSVVATSLSAATFVGGPQQAYAGNLTYLASNIGMILAALLVATLIIPAFYREGVATPYGFLEKRMGPNARRAAATAFLAGRVMASGARVYIIGIPAAMIMFGDPSLNPETAGVPEWQIVAAIVAMTVVGIAYTLAGGVRSVIWTDVIQMAVFLTAIGAALWLLVDRIPGGAETAIETLSAATTETGASKLTLIDLSINFDAPYTLLACCTGFVLMGIASYGLDQDMTQRMLTCKTATRGALSVITANLAAVPVVAMFLVVGLLLFVFYQRPELMGDAGPDYAVDDSRQVFLTFILRELPAGLSGLMMAGLFAAGLSSMNSGLNSMASTVVNDFYKEIITAKSDAHYLAIGRVLVVVWGFILGGFATLCVYWQSAGDQTLIDFALGVMTFAYAGLLGVFFAAVLTKRGSGTSAIAALIVGFLAIFAMNRAACSLIMNIDAILDSADRSVLSRIATETWELAFPWKLAIGAGLSTLTCVLGRRAGQE